MVGVPSSNIPMLADVNKDGIVDVVTTDLKSGVCVLNSTNGHPLTNADGTLLYQTRINGRHNHYQSSIYDIDGDGNLEVLSGDGYEDLLTILQFLICTTGLWMRRLTLQSSVLY